MDARPPLIDAAAHERRGRLRGIGLMCVAVLLFALLDTSAKLLTSQMHAVQITWSRYAVALVFALLFVNPISHPGAMRSQRPWLQIGRSALLLTSTGLNIVALRYLQLDQTVSILFATPFMVAVLAGPLLGEWVGIRRWMAIIVGFLGVIVVTRPGAGGIHPAAILSFMGAGCYSLYIVATRLLSRCDSDQTTLFYSNIAPAVAVSAAVPFFWQTPDDLFTVLLMVAVGTCGGVGHWLLIIAHRLTPAAVLSPFIYTQIVWMISLGYLVFDDVPSSWTLAGASIVIASGIYLLYRERVVKGER